jgi:hypothetical protein
MIKPFFVERILLWVRIDCLIWNREKNKMERMKKRIGTEKKKKESELDAWKKKEKYEGSRSFLIFIYY